MIIIFDNKHCKIISKFISMIFIHPSNKYLDFLFQTLVQGLLFKFKQLILDYNNDLFFVQQNLYPYSLFVHGDFKHYVHLLRVNSSTHQRCIVFVGRSKQNFTLLLVA